MTSTSRVDQILQAMPDREFEVTFIGSTRESTGEAKYSRPKNLSTVREIFLHDPASARGRFSTDTRHRALELVRQIRSYLNGEPIDPLSLLDAACEVASRCALRDFWELPENWDLVREAYDGSAHDCSFKEFYWNTWNFAAHLWALLGAVDQVPHAPVYHAVCTGYAGMLGALLKHRRGGRFLLSEHGIYVKERLEDLRGASWIADPGERVPLLGGQSSVLTDLWMQFFLFQAKISYAAADQIVSLFGRNADIQVEFGADREKIRVIPNGVAPVGQSGRSVEREGPVVGFLGRVVPIKDVKTLLRAMTVLRSKCPSAQLLIAGPVDEDPVYFAECKELKKTLGLEDVVSFQGKVSPDEFLQKIDVMVLTSLSEGLPFALLEALAAGVPTVATDVGACRELIEGRPAGDGVRGCAGIVTPVAEPEQTGAALATILGDQAVRQQYGETGRKRAMSDYALKDVVKAYDELYDL